MTSGPLHHDLSGMARRLKIGLGISMGVTLLVMAADGLDIQLMNRAMAGREIPDREVEINQLRLRWSALIGLVAFVMVGIGFLRWAFLAGRNARALGAKGMEFSPASVVWWYFVPIANLWKPYQAMEEIGRASHPDYEDNWREAPGPTILPAWWALWILAHFFGGVAWQLQSAAERADTAAHYLMASWAGLAAKLFELPLGVLAIVVVGQIQRRQAEKALRLRAALEPTDVVAD